MPKKRAAAQPDVDVASMKVAELKAALQTLGLETSGKKAVLAERLTAANATSAPPASASSASASSSPSPPAAPSLDSAVDEAFAAITAEVLAGEARSRHSLGSRKQRSRGTDSLARRAAARLESDESKQIMSRSVLQRAERSAVDAPAPAPRVARWSGIETTKMTEAVRQDLDILRMRNFINPKKHYKANDHKWRPTEFQVGRVIVGAHEYYSALGGSRGRRNGSLLDGLESDDMFRDYAKRKFRETNVQNSSGSLRGSRGGNKGKKRHGKKGKKH